MEGATSLATIRDIDNAALLRASHQVVIEAEKQCRVYLAPNWKEGEPERQRVLSLKWNNGGPNGRDTLIPLAPNRSIVQPLWKVRCWFGPFDLPALYAKAENERERQALKNEYVERMAYVLNQYDYERPLSVSLNGRKPIGPHRFPDVTVTILESDGNEWEPIRLHRLYEIGEFDLTYPLDSFGKPESPDAVRAHYETQLTDQAARHAEQIARMEASMRETAALVKGFITGKEMATSGS